MADKAPPISFIDALRRNRVGALLSGIIVTVATALVLSAAVPDDCTTANAVILILLLAVAVGFTVKVASAEQDAPTLLTAGALAAIGVPIVFIAGGAIAFGGYAGATFDDSILESLTHDYLTVGSAIAAVVAVIVAGWGPRTAK